MKNHVLLEYLGMKNIFINENWSGMTQTAGIGWIKYVSVNITNRANYTTYLTEIVKSTALASEIEQIGGVKQIKLQLVPRNIGNGIGDSRVMTRGFEILGPQ